MYILLVVQNFRFLTPQFLFPEIDARPKTLACSAAASFDHHDVILAPTLMVMLLLAIL